MEYKINQLAQISGVTTRTLRYYDEMGLLSPERVSTNGYRVYRQEQVDKLQQILFYRELGVALHDIKAILSAPEFDRQKALEQHLSALKTRRENINRLIENVTKTIHSIKEGIPMSDKEKFEGFKQDLIKQNADKFGEEVAAKFGKEAVDASNQKLAGITEAQWQKQQSLSEQIFILLEKAITVGDPACPEAQQAADLHRQWLCLFWPEGMYSGQAHLALAEGYVSDERFTAFYDDKLGNGTAQFLRDAIAIYVM